MATIIVQFIRFNYDHETDTREVTHMKEMPLGYTKSGKFDAATQEAVETLLVDMMNPGTDGRIQLVEVVEE